MGENKMTSAQRAKLQKERKKKIRDAKNYQKERRQAVKSKSSSSNNRPVSIEEERRNQRATGSKRPHQKAQHKSGKLRKNDYGDAFFVDETKQRKDAYNKKQRAKKNRQKPPLTPKQRRRRHIITYSLIFIVVVAVCFVLSLTVFFKTEKINIEGNSLYEEDKIVLLSGVQMEQNIFISKFSSTPEKISDSLPYIEEAWVDFKIPDTITISVKNATPAYVFISNDKFYTVSDKGKVLGVSDKNTENLTIVVGFQVTDEDIGKYLDFEDVNAEKLLNEISDCCKDNGFENISYIDISDASNIFIVYDNRIKIIIGLPEDISYKLKTAMTIINDKLDMNGSVKSSGVLDVSDCNTTKKSYFKDGVIEIDSNVPTTPTEPSTEATETTDENETGESNSADWTPSNDNGNNWNESNNWNDGNNWNESNNWNEGNNWDDGNNAQGA